MKLSCLLSLFLAAFLAIPPSTARISAAEIRVIEASTEPPMSGKEVDWIYGDYLMENAQISFVIAAPIATRDANMTIRNIGGSILDLTLNHPSNDQLSAYTPAAGRYLFHDPSTVETGRDGDAVFWQCRSSRTLANDGTTTTVRYRLADGDAFVEATVTIEGDAAAKVQAFDGVRADGWFEFKNTGNVAYCEDAFFRQTIGFKSPVSQQPPTWKKGRPYQLHYAGEHLQRSDGKLSWTVHIYPATSPIDLISAAGSADVSSALVTFKVIPEALPDGDVDWVNRAKVSLRLADTEGKETQELYTLQTDDRGFAHARLVPGNYVAVASAIGYKDAEVAFQSTAQPADVDLPITSASGFEAEVTDEQGNRIPFKATIYCIDGDQPDFGPSSTRTFVENLAYSVHGRLRCPLNPGKYEIFFSRGPEYNSERKEVEISPATISKLVVQLDRVVDTTGWISADLHSHSSPSGDNTSDQYGRVENLLCEHIEFAPCTEHNRISSYTPHLEQMKLSHLMATCTGMELTGSLLPVNHQNAFPLHQHPHTQDGGGPRTSSNPVVQIERLAMWDDASQKVVQMNHPNLHQIYGDLDTDGVPDKGFRGMLKWADVVEVHPLETIFQDIANNPPGVRRMRIPLFQWMQLLNQGYRIPGVINTDAHYNHHGSGWRRNWFFSSTDDPANISTDEMVREIEAGHIVMSTGPFLSLTGHAKSNPDVALPGDELIAADGKVTLKVTVQCPNWLDVNRVQVFVNGRPSEKHNYTRKNSPKMFGDVESVRKFDSSIELTLQKDAHVIVATIGEGMTMERVMGPRYGKRPPIAVSNPIFVDVDKNGFQSNGDELGLPLPVANHESR
ncbi:CehA/McbA family metallohydrolase [Novipirellula sp. SH528]|uniref:CehA/McbA family metallohydrolase n=1 Tax=Novipirellula sp. SH528 TaxID=3454466 RepID=UPI003FA144AC